MQVSKLPLDHDGHPMWFILWWKSKKRNIFLCQEIDGPSPLFRTHTHKPCLSIWLPRTMVLVVFYLQNRLCVNGEMLVPKGLLKSWGVGQNTFQNHSDSHWLHWLLLKLPILPLLGMTRVPPSILWTLTDPGFRKGPCSTEPWIEVPKCP